MFITEPVIIDLQRPYPPWQQLEKKSLQYQIKSDGSIKIARIRPSMTNPKSRWGWSCRFEQVLVEKKQGKKEVTEIDARVICVFDHGPILITEKKLDYSGEEQRILIKGKDKWWQLDQNENLLEINFGGIIEEKIITIVQFTFVEENTGKKSTHTVTKDIASLER